MLSIHSVLFRCFLLISILSSVVSKKNSAVDVPSLTSANADEFLSKKLVLIEFYAPWCGACQNFERTYTLIAKALQPDGFVVVKVNIDENQALASRFALRHIPAVYLIREGSTYSYDGPTTFDAVVNFARSEYRESQPISYLVSPMGPIGIAKGMLVRIGIAMVNIQPYIMEKLGLSQFASYAITALTFGFVLFLIIFVAVYIHLSHEKID